MSKFHGVLTSCRVKRSPRSAAFPNLWSKAYESVSERSRRPRIDEQGAKFVLCKNDIGGDERCWIISMSQAFPRQLFIAAKERPGAVKKVLAKKNSGAPSQVKKDLTRSPAIEYLMSFHNTKIQTSKFYLYNRNAASNQSFKHPTAQVMNVISWLWNPPLVKKFIGVEKTCEKSMNSVQGW